MQLWSKNRKKKKRYVSLFQFIFTYFHFPPLGLGPQTHLWFVNNFQIAFFSPGEVISLFSFSYKHWHTMSFQTYLLLIFSNISFLFVKWLCFLILLRYFLSQIPFFSVLFQDSGLPFHFHTSRFTSFSNHQNSSTIILTTSWILPNFITEVQLCLYA